VEFCCSGWKWSLKDRRCWPGCCDGFCLAAKILSFGVKPKGTPMSDEAPGKYKQSAL
jgi:hypothetical protein